MRRRKPSRTLGCTEPGCRETARYEYDNQREYVEAVRKNHTYTCCRHSKGAGVLSMDRLKVEWTSEPSKPLAVNPADPYRSWGHSGVLIGHGYYAEGCDFPTGTRLKITVEVLLPMEVKNELA